VQQDGTVIRVIFEKTKKQKKAQQFRIAKVAS